MIIIMGMLHSTARHDYNPHWVLGVVTGRATYNVHSIHCHWNAPSINILAILLCSSQSSDGSSSPEFNGIRILINLLLNICPFRCNMGIVIAPNWTECEWNGCECDSKKDITFNLIQMTIHFVVIKFGTRTLWGDVIIRLPYTTD